MTDNLQWVKVFTHFLTAINFGLVALALMVLLRRHDIGHRTLIRLGVVFNALICGDSVFGVWNQYHRHSNPYAMMRFGTAIFGTMVVVYFFVTNQDIIRTLRISELWNRLRSDELSDSDQARLQLTYASQATLKRSQEMVMGCSSRTRGTDGDGGTNMGNAGWGRSPNSGGAPHSTSYPRT
jgi:hypothetical protein